MNNKERLYKVLNREKADRPPVVCPGGMMSPAVTEALQQISENHFEDADAMAEVAARIYEQIGFENYGVPYCMTVESEEMGAKVDRGSKKTEARVTGYSEVPLELAIKKWSSGEIEVKRSRIVLDAISKLKNDKIPVVGNITGHISVATSIYEPIDIFKLFRKDPALMRKYLGMINDYLKAYAHDMVKAGADVIAMSDPSSTGEILGVRNFAAFSVPVYKDLVNYIHKLGVPFILHICGSAENIIAEMEKSGADALSFDSVVSIAKAKALTQTPVMGNVSTFLLSSGTKEKIKTATEFAIKSGADIAAPACGIGMETSIDNMRTMVETVQGSIV